MSASITRQKKTYRSVLMGIVSMPLFVLGLAAQCLADAPAPNLVAGLDDGGHLYAMDSNGNGTFSSYRNLADEEYYARGVVLGDFDGDGDQDIIMGHNPDGILHYVLFRNDGTAFTRAGDVATMRRTGWIWAMDMTAGDFNNDGRLDFIASGDSTMVTVYLGNGDGTFRVGSYLSTLVNGRGLDAGDFNEDGNLDFVRVVYGGSAALYVGDGTGKFSPCKVFTDAGDDPYGAAAGDFDDDGHLDLLINTGSSGNAYLYKGDGRGNFAAGVYQQSLDFDDHASYDAFDYNNDCKLDIVVARHWGQGFWYFPGNGDGTFGTAVQLNKDVNGNVVSTPNIALAISAPPLVPMACRPSAAMTADPGLTVSKGNQITFNGGASTPGASASITNYAWDFGDGSTGEGASISHTFANEGRFSVRLTVTGSSGKDSIDQTVVVSGGSPTAVAGGPYTVTEAAARFGKWWSTLSGIGSTDTDGVVSYAWDFGGSYTEDFDDGDDAGWAKAQGGTWAVEGETNKTYRQSDPNIERCRNLFNAPLSDDYSVEVDVTTLSGWGNEVQLLFDAIDISNTFELILRGRDSWEHDLLLYRCVNGSCGSLLEIDVPFDLSANTAHRLKAEVRGATVSAYLDGYLIFSQAVRRFPYGGKAGLSTYRTDTRFDNFKVTGLPTVSSNPLGHHTYLTTGDYNASLTVTDAAGQQSTAQASITVSGGNPPSAAAGGPYALGEADATSGAWQLYVDSTGSNDDSGLYQYNWDFGDGSVLTTYATAAKESYAAAGQVLYGYDLPGARLFFTGLQDSTTCQVTNLITGQGSSINIGRYSTNWHDGPGDYKPFKIVCSKPVLVNETNESGHTAFIPALDGGAVGHEFTFYWHGYFGPHYLYAIEDTLVEVIDNSYSLPAVPYTLKAGTYMQLSMDAWRVYTVRSTGRIAIQTVADNSFTAVPAATGDGRGRLFYAATDDYGGGTLAAFAHEAAQVNVFDLDTGAKLYGPVDIAAGEKWYQEGVGIRRLRVESSGDIELWAGDKQGSGIDAMGDDHTFLTGRGNGLKDYRFRAIGNGAVLFVPYDGTEVTIDNGTNSTTNTLNHDSYQVLAAGADYHVTSSKPVFIQVLGGASGWDDFGGYLAGTFTPVHNYVPGVEALPKQYTISLTTIDNLRQASPAAQTTATLTPGTVPVANAGLDQSADEGQGAGGIWTFTFDGSASTDDHAIVQYTWDFGDGSTGSGVSPTHIYARTGTYTVTLTVTDEAMQTNTDTLTVAIRANNPPLANAGTPMTLAETAAVNGAFTLSLDGSGSSDDFGILRYIWDLGTDSFAGYRINTNKWQTNGLISQLDSFSGTGNSNWGNTFAYTIDTSPRADGMFMQARAMHTGGGSAMVGFKNTGTDNSYNSMPHAIYFENTRIRIYENGTDRGVYASYSYDTWYDIRIELKAPSGARYYIRPSSGSNEWQLLYDSTYGDTAELKQGIDVYSGTFYLDDVKQIAMGDKPTVKVYGPTDITLTVEDRAHQTHSATIPFSVTLSNQPPVARTGGPYFTRDGLPTILNGAASSSSREPAWYKWQTGSGEVFYGRNPKVSLSSSPILYPVSAIASSQYYSSGSYTAMQATGPPNVDSCSDNGNAWCPQGYDVGEQWLELTYARRVQASAVRIHETSGSGFVTRVDLYNDVDQPVTVWQGTDTTGCPGWLNVPVSPAMATSKVRIYINSNVSGWNEIDTVALIAAAVGSDTLTLTVTDALGVTNTATTTISIDPGPTVIAVPWQFHGGAEIPHDTWSGKEVLLKAVAYDSLPNDLAYSWDFGDGSPRATGTVSNPRAIEALHTYTGVEGTLFTATLTVTDVEGNSHSDSYPVVIRANAMDAQINMAIDDGLWGLHKNQSRTPGDFYFGSWSTYYSGTFYASSTASALQAFEINGHLEGGKIIDDPYVETVWDGMDFLFRGGMSPVAIGAHPLGDPDSNHNGIGIQAPSWRAPYETGMLIDALVSAQTPDEVVRVGTFMGRTYRDIAQDIIDMYAAGMYKYQDWFWKNGTQVYGPIGGWRYSWGDWPDNSASQWAAIGLIPAERNWGLTIPAWVKSANDNWLWRSYSLDGAAGFGYDTYGAGVATRPSGMVQMVMNGKHAIDPPDPRWAATMGYYATPAKWAEFINDGSWNGTYYARYAFTKAMRLSNTGEVLSNGFNWFRGNDTSANTYGIARKLINEQAQTGGSRGTWPAVDNISNTLTSSWSVIMLTPTLFELPPVANAGGNRIWGDNIAISFDASASRHIDPNKRIVLYEWDFDGDGVFDSTGVSPKAKYTYNVTGSGGTLPKTFNVTLRVTDNGSSLSPPVDPLQDTDTITVQIVEPPHAPVSVPGGPYLATVGVPVTLDGSRSYDIDSMGGDYISRYQWDLDGDWDFDAANGGWDVSGNQQAASVISWTFTAPGTYNIGLRVTDNGLWNDINNNGQVDDDERFTSTAFTTVQVTANLPPVAVLPEVITTQEGSEITVDGSGSSDPNGTAIGTYTWDLDNDGQFDDASGPTIRYRWSQSGTFPIALKVTDIGDNSKTDIAGAEVRVANVTPQVNAGPDVVLYGTQSVPLHGDFFDPAGDLDKDYTLTWDFGDGSETVTGTLAPSHTFAATGTYTVTLSVRDKDGATGTDTLAVRPVLNPTPVLSGTASDQVTLAWPGYQAPIGLHHFAVYQSLSPFSGVADMTPVIPQVNAAERQVTISGLSTGQGYYFAVVSVSDLGTFSNQVTAILATPTTVDTTPPQPVSGLVARMLPGNQVQLTWTPSLSEDTSKYLIFGDNASTVMDWTTPVAEVAGRTTASWTSGALQAGQTYLFGIRAQDGATPPNTEQNTNTVSVRIAYPDLTVEVTPQPAAVDFQQVVAFTLTLRNLGEAATPNAFSVAIYAGGEFQQSFQVSQAIAPQASLTLPVSWQVTLPSRSAAYTMTWKADSSDAVLESNEDNNVSAGWQMTVNRVYFLNTATNPAFAETGTPITLSAVAAQSDNLAQGLDNQGDDAVQVVTFLRAEGVNVAGPYDLAWNGTAGHFAYTLNTTQFNGPFTVLFKLYNADKTALLATASRDIVIGASDYYVSVQTGSDSQGDGSQANPWQTITYALTQIRSPKATLHIAAGVYSALETFPITMQAGVSLSGTLPGPVEIVGRADRDVLVFPGQQGFDSNTMLENLTVKGGTVGIRLEAGATGAAPLIRSLTARDNGVGIRCEATGPCSPQLLHVALQNNTGAGMEILGLGNDLSAASAPVIDQSFVANNGAGLVVQAGGQNNSMMLMPQITRTTMSNNSGHAIMAKNDGGWNSHPEIVLRGENLLLVNNSGDGINLDGSGAMLSAVITNATISANSTGIRAVSAAPWIVNTVVWGNNAALVGVDPATVSYSDIEAVAYDGQGTNMALSPQFIDPAGGNFAPMVRSPLVDRGSGLNAPATDIHAFDRPKDGNNDQNPIIDIGAFELQFHASAGGERIARMGEPLNFTGLATGGSGPYTYYWDFGDATTPMAGSPQEHAYQQPGVYTVRLTVTDSAQNTVVDTARVEVQFSVNAVHRQAMRVGTAFNFAGSASGGAAPYAFRWEFGDGAFADGPNATHNYTATGVYTVQLSVTDSAQKSGAYSAQVEILPQNTMTPNSAALDISVNPSQVFAIDGPAAGLYDWTVSSGTNICSIKGTKLNVGSVEVEGINPGSCQLRATPVDPSDGSVALSSGTITVRRTVAGTGSPNLMAGIDYSGNLYAADSNGDGTFSNYRKLTGDNGLSYWCAGVTLGDFDGDGDQDIIAAYNPENLDVRFILFRNNNGTLTLEGDVAIMRRVGGNWAMDMTAGDFNNDGMLDFIGSGDPTMVVVYLGQGDGTFSMGSYLPSTANGRGLDAGDFNEDGNLDFVRAVHGSGAAALYVGDGTGRFSPGTVFTNIGDNPYGVTAGDFDGDGHLDLIMNTGGGGDAYFYRGDGRGNFAPGIYQPSVDVNDLASLDAFDYNNDCTLDIVAARHYGQGFWYFPGNGDGSFGAAVQLNKDIDGNVINTPNYALGVSAPPLAPMPCRPTAALSVTPGSLVAKGTMLTFNGSASRPGTNGSLIKFVWDFGDGSPLVEDVDFSVQEHLYDQEGKYTVRLTVFDAANRQDGADLRVVVQGDQPVAVPGGPYTFGEQNASQGVWQADISGLGSSDGTGEGLVSYAWDFGGAYMDNFDDGDDLGWSKVQDTWVVDGSLNKSYHQTNASVSRPDSLFNAPLPDDYSVEVDVTAISGPEVHLLFDAIDSSNKFELVLRNSGYWGQDLLLFRVANGVWTQLVEIDLPFDLVPNTTHHLKAEVRGATVSVYLDGDLMFTQPIERFMPGARAGLSTWQTEARFDNFTVTSLPLVSPNPEARHFYRAPGMYLAALTVTDAAGQQSTAMTHIAVSMGQPPIAVAGPPQTLGEAEAYNSTWSVTFDGSASTDDSGVDGIERYLWDFGDGSTGSGVRPTHVYSVPAGQEAHFTVKLTVTDRALQDNVNIDSNTTTVHIIAGEPPVADAGPDQALGEAEAVDGTWPTTFNGSGSTDDSGPAGIASYAWDFGDGGSASGPTPQHTYTRPGTYTVTLTVTDRAGQTGSDTMTVTITTSGSPTANAGPDQAMTEANAVQGAWVVTFDGSASRDAGEGGVITEYEWNFGDGSPLGSGVSPTHTYGRTGVYSVTLTVIDQAAQTGSDTMTVTITPGHPPVADAGGPITKNENEAVNGVYTVTLDGSRSHDDEGPLLRYTWDLGLETFDGTWLNPQRWQTSPSGISQDDALIASSTTYNWGITYAHDTVRYARTGDVFMQARVKQSDGHAMIGFKDTTAGTSFNSMPHAIYFAGGSIGIYEDGADRGWHGSYSMGIWYDIRIELKAPSGARYYIRPSSGATPWELLYDSNYGNNAELRQGLDVHSGTFLVDDLWQGASGPTPTVSLFGPTDITLTVEDNAHQTASAIVPFTVLYAGEGLVARHGGPYVSHDGMPTFLNGETSTPTADIVSYTWRTGSGQVFHGQKAKAMLNATTLYPVSATASSEYAGSQWWANQAAGPPDDPGCSDNGNSWAPAEIDMGEQWLELTYQRKVMATAVQIHESLNSGFVTKVDFWDETANQFVTVWQGTDPTSACAGVLNLTVAPPRETDKVRVYVNTDVAGWNEIDTVGLLTSTSTSDTLTLTVTDSRGRVNTSPATTITFDSAPTVVAVPWQQHGGVEVPHDTWAGKEVLLKAVAYDSSPSTLQYTWNFGDGSPTVSGTVGNPRAIEALHAYQGGEGTLYNATITVTDEQGFSHSDTYLVAIRSQNIDTEINIAIDDGLWWLHKNQARTPGYYLGSWVTSSYGTHYASPTASALQAFEINGHLEGGLLSEDPYVEDVWDGMDFLFRGGMNALAIGMHPLGDPDSNHNGIGIQSSSDHTPYETGMLIDALVSSQTPDEQVRVGSFSGRTYRDIAQDIIDMYAWGMYSGQGSFWKNGTYTSGPLGSWRYNWGEGMDNSASQWAAIGLVPAERNWGLTIPAYVKSANDNWLWYSYSAAAAAFGYSGPGSSDNSSDATRPSGMVQMVMNGKHAVDPPDPRWTATTGYYANPENWSAFINSTYWSGSYYARYAFTKAMRLSNSGEILTNGFNWFRGNDASAQTYGTARKLVNEQWQTGGSRGGWPESTYMGTMLTSSWSVIMLTPTLFELPPVANAGGNRIWGDNIPITFDASASRHMDPNKRIVLYEWDFNGDGVFDSRGVSPKAKHTYNVVGSGGTLPQTFSVTLRVTDNGDSLDPPVDPLQDTNTISVQVVAPPHAPVAVPGGPYQATVGVPLVLDGSRSYDIDRGDNNVNDFITRYEWDLDGTWDFSASGLYREGAQVSWNFSTPGTYNIALRVTDNGVWSEERLTHTAFTTVQVSANQPPVAVLPEIITVPEGLEVSLDGRASSDPNGTEIGAYAWDLDNDGVFDDASGPVVPYRWNQNGTYPIALRVSDIAAEAMTSIAGAEVRVINAAPQVDAGQDVFIFGRQALTLHGQFFDPAGALDAPYGIVWNFGDGSPLVENDLNPSHTFDPVDSNTVTLTVTDKDQGMGSDTLTVRQVMNPQPAVTGTASNQVTLTWQGYQPPAGLHHYAIYQKASPETPPTEVTGMTFVQDVAGDLSQSTVTGLTNLTPYAFAVVSVNEAGAFNPRVVSVLATPAAEDSTPPQAVTGLRARMLADNKVQLTWTPSLSLDTTNYLIYGDNGSGVMGWTTPLANVDGRASAAWVSENLQPGQTYLFGVRAQDDASNTDANVNTVSIRIAYPDLTVDGITGPAEADYNSTAQFTLTLKNQGAAATEPASFAVGVYANSQLLQSFPVSQAIAGNNGTLELAVSWQVMLNSRATPYAMTWKVDALDAVPEELENNNSRESQLLVKRVYFLEPAATPDFVRAGVPIVLSAKPTNSDDLNLILDDQEPDTVQVVASVKAEGVTVDGPFDLVWNGTAQRFTHSLNTAQYDGPFTVVFKLYNADKTALLASASQDIVIGESDYYVDVVNGSDSQGDGSQTNPWQSISHSLAQIWSPRAALHLAPGVYSTLETFPIVMRPGISLVGAAGIGAVPTEIVGRADSEVLVFPAGPGFDENTVLDRLTVRGGSVGILLQSGHHGAAAPIIRQSTIRQNGVGIRCEASGPCSPQISHVLLTDNTVSGLEILGLGDYRMATSAPIIDQSEVRGNATGIMIHAGGGQYNSMSLQPVITRSTIAGNSGHGLLARIEGGWSSQPLIGLRAENLLVINNGGDGINLQGLGTGSDLSAAIVNATISANQTGIKAVGAEPAIMNSVVWGNTVAALAGIHAGSVSYSDIENGLIDAPGPSTMSLAPQFVAPAAGNYEPMVGSPLVDAGSNSNAPISDLRGLPRPKDGNNDQTAAIDIGAFELQFFASAGPDQSVMVHKPLTLAGSSAGGVGPFVYHWEFGDGMSADGQSPPAHAYLAAGVYTVRLSVTDSNQSTVVDTAQVTVRRPTLGDINGDGVIDLRDAIIALKVTTNLPVPPQDVLKEADTNSDGRIDIGDLIYILKHIATTP